MGNNSSLRLGYLGDNSSLRMGYLGDNSSLRFGEFFPLIGGESVQIFRLVLILHHLKNNANLLGTIVTFIGRSFSLPYEINNYLNIE